ncbi:beta-glucosidase BglX [Nibricoccus sp. IMCC34717]|uniref:beta-glucosidase BglX n=1 Tax=Nibricoccus sp. IMCC34717 TaxID=3034021 RepID=UPI00384E2E67
MNTLRLPRVTPVLLGAASVFAALCANSPAAMPAGVPIESALVSSADADARAKALLGRMTLAEKIGQLHQAGIGMPGPSGETTEELVRKGLAGSILWTIDTATIQRLQEIAVKESRLGIPLLFGFDVIHGYRTTCPVPLGLAATWDPALVEAVHALAAREARLSGITWNFSPMVDIARDARWGRMVEGAGEDPFLGSVLARAQVLGIQGPKLGTPDRMLACVKHFAGYGAGEGGRDYDTAYIPEVVLNNVYLPPFEAAIRAGAGSAMTAYMALNDVPATGSEHLIHGVLREQLGFRGLTLSDSWSVASLEAHGYAANAEDAAYRGLMAGVAVDMGSMTYLRNAAALVSSGKIPETLIDQLVLDVLTTKLKLGLFESPYADTKRREAAFNDPANRVLAREAAARSCVLLRNEHGLLPLSESVKSIAVIGPLADSKVDIRGPWTAEGGDTVTLLAAVRSRFPTANVQYVQGADMQRAFPLPWDARNGVKAPALLPENVLKNEVAKAVAAAQSADVTLVALGERANMAGEAASSATLALGGNQLEHLQALVATGKPIVLVLMNGRPLDIRWASENVPAILETWFPGDEGGNAICDVLWGKTNPSGKLPVSWPRSAGQCPTYYNHNNTHSHDDDPLFTSRYADMPSSPLYPFGFGLSYTRFTFSALKLDRAAIEPAGTLSVEVTVTNNGAVAGDEVVQLYVHGRAGEASRPVRQLKGFKRVSLQPGKSQVVTFKLTPAELEYWSSKRRAKFVEPGTYDLWVGGDSRATLRGEFRIE